jgi:asparagine synthase (glutamine-hydrolysing)
MSGIVGMVNLDGPPIERELLDRLTASLAFRGPDGQRVWASGPVGFGHALLRTTRESENERQPCSLDGEVWITADARIDDRETLIDKLAGHGRDVTRTVPDAELILHAYHAWGEQCVEHLLGDFAFAIWDGRERRLFCARDHFGVKPFYYAIAGGCLVFSNTLNCVRLHQDVSDELNDLAIADFLMFGRNQEPATTAFADVQRLPPATGLTCRGGRLRLRRYWAMPTDGAVRYRREADYVERFNELFRCAVGDRLRAGRVAVMMSGGLDSTAVAATAKGVLSGGGRPFDLRAFTTVYDRLIPDRERHFSGLAAEALGIPIRHQAVDDCGLYERWDEPECHTPEPVHSPQGAATADYFRLIASHGRIALTGFGGDPALFPSPTYFRDLLRNRRVGRAVREFGTYFLRHRRLPPLGTGLRSWLRRRLGKIPPHPGYPCWLGGELAARLDLPGRWARLTHDDGPAPAHPVRDLAYQSLLSPYWQTLFEWNDPGASFFPVEVRHPFFDVRLVTYLLAIPPVPWCADKQLLRAAMRGRLPEGIRLRPKTPLAGAPEAELARAGTAPRAEDFNAHPRLARYVDQRAIPKVSGDGDALRVWQNLRPLSLNYWLHQTFQENERGMSDETRCATRRADRRGARGAAVSQS